MIPTVTGVGQVKRNNFNLLKWSEHDQSPGKPSTAAALVAKGTGSGRLQVASESGYESDLPLSTSYAIQKPISSRIQHAPRKKWRET